MAPKAKNARLAFLMASSTALVVERSQHHQYPRQLGWRMRVYLSLYNEIFCIKLYIGVWNAVCNKSTRLISCPNKLSRTQIKFLTSYPDNIFLISYPNNDLISNPNNVFLSRTQIYIISLFRTQITFYLVPR